MVTTRFLWLAFLWGGCPPQPHWPLETSALARRSLSWSVTVQGPTGQDSVACCEPEIPWFNPDLLTYAIAFVGLVVWRFKFE